MRRTGFIIFFIWFVAVIFLVPKIDAYDHSSASLGEEANVPYYVRAMGQARVLLSDLSILQADLYFHSGVGHFYGEHGEGMAIAAPEQEEKHEEAGHEHGAHAGKESKFNVLFKLADNIRLTEHIHLGGSEVKEIIPWLYYAAKIDPHNILAYTLTSYWLSDRLGKTGEALTFLREGLKNNPDSWEINAEIGRVYASTLKDYKISVRFLEKAAKLISKVPHDKFQERYVLTFLAYTYESLGDKNRELAVYKRIGELFPKDTSVQDRVNALSS